MPSLRILGGSAQGRELLVPESARPTGARVRKSLFDLLLHRFPTEHSFTGRFLDLYGGSGAIGLEAASRGYNVTLIEKNAKAIKLLQKNAQTLGLKAQILSGDALILLKKFEQLNEQFDIVFVDPPYQQDIPKVVNAVATSSVLAQGGVLIVQHPVQLTLAENIAEGTTYERRVYGSNVLTLYGFIT